MYIYIHRTSLYELQFAEKTHFYGKSMLITGASQGIGKSIALEVGRRGISHLILASRSKEKLEQVKEEIHIEIRETLQNITRSGKNKLHYQYMGLLTNIIIDTVAIDLSSKTGCLELVDETQTLLRKEHKKPGLNFLVLNHITSSHFGLWLKGDDGSINQHQDNLERMFQINTFSYIWIATAAINTLLRDKGHITVLSSLAGHVGVPNTAMYSSTKHALHGFFNAMRIEVRMMEVNVGIMLAAIGATDTEGAKSVMEQLPTVTWDDSRGAARAILRGIALNKREIFHPHHKVFPVVILYKCCPHIIDWLLRLINEGTIHL